MKRIAFILGLLALFSCGGEQEKETTEEEPEVVEEDESKYQTIWHWEDDFNEEEQEKLMTWITDVYAATEATLGEYPFDLHVYFYRRERETAVTFGHTSRGVNQSVHFYVNPDYPMEDFMDDWIAPHEISHLSMPPVSKEAKWYAEGYATYLSRKVMMNMDLYTQEEFDSIYYHKIHGVMNSYCSSTSTFAEVSDSLLRKYEYGDMYWGGTSFFMTTDSLLQLNHDMGLTDLITEYQSCCRLSDKNLDDVMTSYDELIGDSLFTNLLWQYQNVPCIEVMEGY